MELLVTPKCHACEDHACDQLEFLKGLSDFGKDWDEQLHQLGLKNNRRTKAKRNLKYKLYTQWEQLCGNWEVQGIKKEVNKKGKQNLQNSKGADTAAALLLQKTHLSLPSCASTRQLTMDWEELTIESRRDFKAIFHRQIVNNSLDN
jgi:hypothetical protein